jgi:thioredoxin 1
VSPHPIDDAAQLERFLSGPGALILFTAPWCSPGERLAQRLRDLAPTLPVPIAVVDADRHPALPRGYGIAGLPCLILVRDGLVAGQRTGELTREQVADWVEAALEPGPGPRPLPGLNRAPRSDGAPQRP